jgi:hypothetical protein
MQPGQSANANLVTLDDRDEYRRYFDLLSTVGERLRACYRLQDPGGSYEAGIVPGFVEKLRTTIGLLRVKHTHAAPGARPLWIDVTESGFPNAMELDNLKQDLLRRKERVLQLPVAVALKRAVLDRLFQDLGDPPELLAQLSERAYFDLLEQAPSDLFAPGPLFLPFTPGDVTLRGADARYRSYVVSWACYDFETNRPYVHVMTVDQDATEEPLEKHGTAYAKLLEVLRAEGSRAPDVGILALAIDDAIDPIHPKILKRLCIGPLYAPILFDRGPAAGGDAPSALETVLRQHGRRADDFVLVLRDEIVFSKAQQVTRSLLSPKGRIREIFAITETDPECYARRASVVHTDVMLPHDLLQRLGPDVAAAAPELRRCRKISYDEAGAMTVHG